MRARTFAWLSVMTIVGTACSGSGNGNAPSSGAGGGTGSSADCASGKACVLLTSSDVDQALNATYTATDGMSLDDTPGERSSCFYSHANDNAASLQMACLAKTLTASDYSSFESAEESLGFLCTSVSGIGDAAFWCVSNPDGGSLPIGPSLLFFSGDVEADLNVTSIGTPTRAISDFEPVAEQLAKTILSRF